MAVPANASTIPITISFSCFVSICTQYVGTKMGVVSFVPFLLTFPWFSCKSGIWNYSKTTKHKIIMPFRQIATKRCNILGNSNFKFMPLDLLHLLWPSTMGKNVCDWWCDTRGQFTLFLVSQVHFLNNGYKAL
jgi:hypothetical protein